jgi:predicted 3-demethylubiquinone-9 3-methyltransferase (glyoxalase superfamily)/uncharacterized protein YndB with AHSA1/START domain
VAASPDAADRTIVIVREFDAPRELVWEAWTKPEHVAKWWGPRGFTTTVTELDLRPGGRSRYVMRGPDGAEYPVKGVFREVVPPERIVTTDEFEEGYDYDNLDLPKGVILTVLFEDLGGRTRLTLRIAHPTVEDRRKHEAMGVIAGWESTFGCLADYLAARRGQKITPFLWFDGNAEEAANFYVSVFPDSGVVSVLRYGDAGPGPKGAVMLVTFRLAGQTFHALNGGPTFKFTEAVSLFVDCKTQEEVDDLWARLSAGGSESHCGWLKDKYGLSWQVIPSALMEMHRDPDPAKSRRVMEAMRGMGKIDLAGLRRAYDGA